MLIEELETFSDRAWEGLENNLLPAHGPLDQRLSAYAAQILRLCYYIPSALLSSLCIKAIRWIKPKPIQDDPLTAFAKRPQWEQTGEFPPILWGFATAAFHDNGPLTHKDTNFGDLYLKRHPERFNPHHHFPNMWDHPERWLDRLVETGATTFRFSVPRDLVEPCESLFSEAALQKITDFCDALILRGIEPIVTLEHNSYPLYQNLDSAAGRESFVAYAITVTEKLYQAGVRKVITFNEIGVDPFQGYLMGDFPPYHKGDFKGAALRFTNIMKTHGQVYHALKSRFPDLEIGISHDPIRFRFYHKINPLFSSIERLVCKYFTDTNHTMVMTCLKTGEIRLKVPFLANYRAHLDEPPPFDFFGLQYYTDPLVYVSLRGGDSVTRVPGERTTNYRYRMYPQGLASALQECAALGRPVDLTEIGIDNGVNHSTNEAERIAYFEKILQVIQKAIHENINIRSLHFWTLIDNFDWHQGWDCPEIRFGFYRFDPTTGEISPTPLVDWLMQKSKVAPEKANLDQEIHV